ncbi:MAG: trypsin-like peptidase domain-containing protein [Myxococcota bacterium]|nr:trypsin-like peptidase domain-containing protein [Myxococcota bacterium]MEC9440171.1 trypsin-like peptidase domain-containing protein [Myxococcota bacterium]
MHRSIKTTLMITTFCAAIAGVGPASSPARLTISEANAQQPANTPSETSPEAAETTDATPAKPAPVVRGGLPDVASVFEQEKGKVVAVKTEMAQSVSNPFWGQRVVPRMGQGSGFVVEADGHIITNYHVVAGAQKIEVLLEEGGKRYQARLIGADKKTDIALLKIEAPPNLQATKFGSSDALRVGEWVVAIGNPFGLEYSVTAGIVSAKGRNLGQGLYDNFLQTDASINPGNSGGPLFNLAGEVVGVNTAIIRDAQGIGFAVPIDMVKQLLPQLKSRGYIVRGYVGAGLQRLSDELIGALDLKLEPDYGVLIGSIEPDGPSAKGGLQVEDIVLSFNGVRTQRVQELLFAVAETPPGTVVEVEVLRAGQILNLQLEVGERPDTEKLTLDRENKAKVAESTEPATPPVPTAKSTTPEDKVATKKTEDPPKRRELGIQVIDTTPEQASEAGLEAPAGVYVLEVKPGGAAEGALRPGDIILQVDDTELAGVSDFIKTLSGRTPGEPLRMRVLRGGRTIFVAIRL